MRYVFRNDGPNLPALNFKVNRLQSLVQISKGSYLKFVNGTIKTNKPVKNFTLNFKVNRLQSLIQTSKDSCLKFVNGIIKRNKPVKNCHRNQLDINMRSRFKP